MTDLKLLIAATLAGASLAPLAPSVAAEQPEAKGDVAALEEVVVTATRREQRLQDVPMSVAVLGGEALEAAGVVDFTDAGFSAGNVVFNASGHNPYVNTTPSIRGVAGRAGVYLDDVIVGPGGGSPTQLVDVERIEILRGPQGATFGRDTIAGAMNIITRKPSFTWTGSADLELGSYGLQQERAYVSGPLGGDLAAFSLSGFSRTDDGVDRTIEGLRVNDARSQGGRASLLLRPSEALHIQLSYDYTKDAPDSIWAWHLLYALPGAIGQVADPANLGKIPDQSFPSVAEQKHQGGTLRVDWRVGGVTVTSVTAYRKNDASFVQDLDRTQPDYLMTDNRTRQHQFSEELRVSGATDRVQWLAGLFYFDNDSVTPGTIYVNEDYVFGGAPLSVLYALGFIPYPQLAQVSEQHDELRSIAAYGSADISLTEKWRLTVGLRYTSDRVDSTSAVSNGPVNGFTFGPTLPALPAPYVYPTIDKGRFNPSLSLGYAFRPEVLGYAAIGTGYQAAAYNSQQACEGPTALVPCLLKPEIVTSYELGVKSQLLDQRMTLNAAIFYMDYKDMQRFQSFTIGGTQIQTNTNAAESSARGVELDFAFRATRSVTLDGSVGYTNTQYDSYTGAFVPTDSGAPAVVDLSGTTLPFAPHWTGSMNAQYGAPLSDRFNWVARIEGQYRSSYKMNNGNDLLASTLKVGDQFNLNLALGLTQGGRGWSAWVRGRNVLDRRYADNADINGFSSAGYVTMSDPSIYTLQVQYQF